MCNEIILSNQEIVREDFKMINRLLEIVLPPSPSGHSTLWKFSLNIIYIFKKRLEFLY